MINDRFVITAVVVFICLLIAFGITLTVWLRREIYGLLHKPGPQNVEEFTKELHEFMEESEGNNMSEYISRKKCCEAFGCLPDGRKGCDGCFMLDVPNEDVKSVVCAKWIECDVSDEIATDELMRKFFPDGVSYACSNCRICEPKKGWYCPNCGAKMDGEKNENN